MDANPPDGRIDLRKHPLEIHAAGPLRTGITITMSRFGDGYNDFRAKVRDRLGKALERDSNTSPPPELRLPDTAHGEPDDIDAGDGTVGPQWSGFGSRPYRPTGFLEIDRTVANFVVESAALEACASRLGCAQDPACAQFCNVAVYASRFNARIYDSGFAVLTVRMHISGSGDLSVDELRTIVDCAVEAAKSEVEERFARLRPKLVEAIRLAFRDWRQETAEKTRQATVPRWLARLRKSLAVPAAPLTARNRGRPRPGTNDDAALAEEARGFVTADPAASGDRQAARGKGYGFLIAFHRLFMMAYGDASRDRRTAELMSERLLETSHEGGLHYCRPHPDYAAYLGYLNSVFVFPQERCDEDRTHRLSPLPVIQFYEFAFAAMQDLDRRLFLDLETTQTVLERLERSSRDEREQIYLKAQDAIADLREQARFLEFRIESDIDTLPPAHLTYWYQILASWRVPELRRGIDEKVAFLEQHYGNMHQRMEADLTRRTNAIILFLTGMTALSVLSDTLGFAFDRQYLWGPNSRNILSLLAGALIFGFAAWLYWTRTRRSELTRLERDSDGSTKRPGSKS